MPTPTTPPSAVRRALRKLGQDVADARKRRGLTMETVADRAFTTRKTLARVEDYRLLSKHQERNLYREHCSQTFCLQF